MLHELADDAYFRRTVVVAAAHNTPVESFPWRFSVRHLGREPRPAATRSQIYYNPSAAGRVLRARASASRCAWRGGAPHAQLTGNSFATPHSSPGSARVVLRAKHPGA